MTALPACWQIGRGRPDRISDGRDGSVVEIHGVAIDRVGPDLAVLEACLTGDERARGARFRRHEDRTRFVVGRALLRRELSRRLCVEPDEIPIVIGPAGKPFVAWPNGSCPWRFNLSHSGRMVLVAIGSVELGVDVEEIVADRRAAAIARQFFAGEEVQAIESQPPECRRAAFFTTWTRKEAVLKAIGSGLRAPLDTVQVPVVSGPSSSLLAGPLEAVVGCWSLWHIPIGADHVAALAVRGPVSRLRLVSHDLDGEQFEESDGVSPGACA